ncbi:MAG: lamin tail domain-containing protein [Patescibacteria group bacterium]
MSKKVIFFFMGVALFLFSRSAHAEVIVNEVAWMGSIINSSSDANAEWIELKNTGSENVDVSGWILVAGDGTPNILFSSQCTNLVIDAGSLFLLERTDDESVPGILADCIYTGALGNTGENLTLKNASGGTVQFLNFSVAWSAGDNATKETMQWNGSSWVTAAPTPKTANEAESSSPPPASSDDTGSADTGGIVREGGGGFAFSSANAVESKKIKIQITTKMFAFAGNPLSFEAITYGHNGERLYNGKYFWNFGDGDFREAQMNNKEKFTHTYFYPGDYVVSVEYYLNGYSDIPEASEKIAIKIIGADIVISNTGDEKDFFVELTNNGAYEADISRWILSNSGQNFFFPKNTILGSKKKITLSSKITNFSIADKNNLKLLNSEGNVIFDYASSLMSAAPVVVPIKEKALPQAPVQIKREVSADKLPVEPFKDENEKKPESEKPAPALNLAASVVESDAGENNSSISYMPVVISTILIGTSAGAVYFIRQRKILPEAGSDFKILDE